MNNNMSNGGSDIQYNFYQKYVDQSIQQKVNLYRIPNPNAKSFYHIDGFIDQSKINVAWIHQSYDMVESLNLINQQDQFDRIICVSEWQKEMFIKKLNGLPEKLSVIKNGIIPIPLHKKPKGICNLIYMSTPYRGLDVLLQAFQYIQHLDICLHVFSSMSIYGQDDKDEEYEYLYQYCKNHPKIVYYGFVPHSEILSALTEMHIFAYPNTFEETSCISLLEALSAQLSVVCPNYGALKETAFGFANMYEYIDNKMEHAIIFSKHLQNAINKYDQSNHFKQKSYIDLHHDWNTTIKTKWENLLQKTIIAKIPKTNFYYG